MKKTNVTISFDEEKLTALRLYMEQKDLQLEDELTKAVESFYGKHVPANVREFIEMRSGEPADSHPEQGDPGRRKRTKRGQMREEILNNASERSINNESRGD